MRLRPQPQRSPERRLPEVQDADEALGRLLTLPRAITCDHGGGGLDSGVADEAFDLIDKAVEYRYSGLSEVVVENLLDKIHSDPRWLPFLRKIGKAPDQLAKVEFHVPLPPTDTRSPAR
jgi:hypothetical protein